MTRATIHAAILIAFTAGGALANQGDSGQSYADMVLGGESGGRLDATNSVSTATGLYQFTYGTLQDLGYVKPGQRRPAFGAGEWDGIEWTGKGGVTSRSEFMASRAAQDAALGDFTDRNWERISSNVPEGQTVNGVPMERGGALYAAHFLGSGGFNEWASCDFQAQCIPDAAVAGNTAIGGRADIQQMLMNRVAEGSGADPSTISSGGSPGWGGGPPIETPMAALMPWTDSPAMP